MFSRGLILTRRVSACGLFAQPSTAEIESMYRRAWFVCTAIDRASFIRAALNVAAGIILILPKSLETLASAHGVRLRLVWV